jgi:hypothetical protein
MYFNLFRAAWTGAENPRNLDTVRRIVDTAILSGCVRAGRELLVHIATSGPENEIDSGASQSLELGIVFMLTDSCQPAVEDVSRQ